MYKKKITITGNKVQDVGYRLFLLDEAEGMLVTHLDAKNLRKKTTQEIQEKVEVLIGGDEDNKDRVDKFVEFIKNNFPEHADVDKPIGDAENYEGDIRTIESFSRCLSVHQLTKFAVIGTKIVIGQENLRKDTNENFAKMIMGQENLRTETNENFKNIDNNFKDLDSKYRLISEGMFAIVNELKETHKSFEKRIEKTEKNIEELLRILIEKK